MQMQDLGALLGRFLLAFIFIGNGLDKLSNPGLYIGLMSRAGFPAAGLVLYAAAAVETLGGFAIFLGVRERLAALVLSVYLIPVTIVFHVMRHDMTNTLKNVAIAGALLMVATQGGGGLRLETMIAPDAGAMPEV